MEVRISERRNSPGHPFRTTLRVCAWQSACAELGAESQDLSERGVFCATNAPLAVGSPVEILLKMPEAISGKPTTEWRCTGHVVRLNRPRGRLGVGVQFDCYEILRMEPALRG